MSVKIVGLDGLIEDITNAQTALQAIEGELGRVEFQPNDPASIEAAIQEAEALIDDRLGAYAQNPLIKPIIQASKESFRSAIIDRAATFRLENGLE